MKVRASVKKMCRNCKIVKREGVVRQNTKDINELSSITTQPVLCKKKC